MSELTRSIGQKLPRIMLAGLLGTAACGESVRDDVFPDLNCGKKPNNTITRTYNGMAPDQKVLLGHTYATNRGIEADVSISINSEGLVSAQKLDRGDIDDKAATIQAGPDGGVTVLSGDERFAVSPWKETGSFAIHIVGQCVKPA